MYSGISGMKNFQTKLDVIGNNIANVNTFGYKKGRVTFKDMVSQTISGATASNLPTVGGTNPKQVGLGSQLAAIDTIDTQGSLQTTGRVLDLGIQGDGYLEVKKDGGTYFTRSGNLYLDQGGNLVTGSGDLVQDTTGANITIANVDKVESMSIGSDGSINLVGTGVSSTQKIGITKFTNNAGLEKVGNNLYRSTTNTGTITRGIAGQGGAGSIVSGTLEMSNVDLSEEFTEMIVAQRGFQANTRIITTSDEILQELVNLKR
jgi:flagellar hook protein FlgE